MRLMKTLSPRYKVPVRNSIKKFIIKKYESVSVIFKTLLSNVNNVSLTTDIWTDFQMRSYLGVTVHFVHNLKLVSATLGVVNLGESHTADYISKELVELLGHWEIPHDKILAFVTDNGANMVKAITTTFSSNRHVRCFGHTLNLVCENSLQVECVKAIIAQVRAIAVSYTHLDVYKRQGTAESRITFILLWYFNGIVTITGYWPQNPSTRIPVNWPS